MCFAIVNACCFHARLRRSIVGTKNCLAVLDDININIGLVGASINLPRGR